jgi:hypothetical protein
LQIEQQITKNRHRCSGGNEFEISVSKTTISYIFTMPDSAGTGYSLIPE